MSYNENFVELLGALEGSNRVVYVKAPSFTHPNAQELSM